MQIMAQRNDDLTLCCQSNRQTHLNEPNSTTQSECRVEQSAVASHWSFFHYRHDPEHKLYPSAGVYPVTPSRVIDFMKLEK